MAQDLMESDERRRTKPQEADGIGNPPCLMSVDERLVEGDIGASAPNPVSMTRNDLALLAIASSSRLFG
ncbi:hypothetical protein ACRAVF_19405 [Bradyrhizobium oligotrophicum S58]